jgi:hypothetical protein
MSALTDLIRREVEIVIREERKRTEALLAEIVAEMTRRFDQKLERTDNVLDGLNGDVRELFDRKPDARGVIRRQYFTPRPR